MRNRKRKLWIITGVIITAAVILFLILLLLHDKTKKDQVQAAARNSQEQSSQSSLNRIQYQGKTYQYNTDLKNILFLGVDKRETVSLQNMPGTAGQSDCIMLLSLDSSDNTAKILQISRDSMTDIDLYDVNGNYYTTLRAQLATQYAYGGGGTSSCWAAKKTVSRLLFDLQIDGYIALNLESISVINDAIGGVTITMGEGDTAIDDSFTAGASVTLDGAQAEHYVRYRNTTEQGSNNGRMERQTRYISALFSALKSKAGSMGDLYQTFSSVLEPYMVTDLSGDQINALSQYEYQPEETAYIPGEVHAGEVYEEYWVDDEKLQELLIQRFYKEIPSGN
ncbi:MAG: LCP family protein [Lachnospiraceae bacterium]|nr:LCP family protein [Lachnospiraceae bacterium]